jgi:hypothetical protein
MPTKWDIRLEDQYYTTSKLKNDSIPLDKVPRVMDPIWKHCHQ